MNSFAPIIQRLYPQVARLRAQPRQAGGRTASTIRPQYPVAAPWRRWTAVLLALMLSALGPWCTGSYASEPPGSWPPQPHLALLPQHTKPASYVSPDNGQHWPGKITRGYDPPEHPWLPGHRGIDIALHPGAPVFAAGAGTVHYVGVIAGIPTVSIAHPAGFRTSYQPVHAQVQRGDTVTTGMVIGTLAVSAKHPDLHFGVITGPKQYMNPLDLLRPPEVVLLPLIESWETG